MSFLYRIEAPLLLAATTFYLVATLLLWVHLFLMPRDVDNPQRRTPDDWGRAILLLGAVLHLGAIAGQGPSVFVIKAGVVGLFGWFLIVTFLVIGRKIGAASGAIVAPLALVAALYSLTAPQLHSYVPAGRLDTFWIAAHVFFFLSGYVALAFAFAAALLYLMQEGLLKRKKLSGLWRKLPSLEWQMSGFIARLRLDFRFLQLH
jgi:ABC-type uncharacterized transport system permease subunit